ncbi:MAG: hypothetical protein ACLP5H_34185 [Desulfomonilaceae bacterium]
MTTEQHLTREDLAKRWNASTRTIDRLRQHGLLPWVDLGAGKGIRPIVRFTLADVENYERSMRQAQAEGKNDTA